jgi:hypothetical protein
MTARRGDGDGDDDGLAAWVRRTNDAAPPLGERRRARLAALLDTRDLPDTRGPAAPDGDGHAA